MRDVSMAETKGNAFTNESIRFSVLMTIYNKAEFLSEAIESVLNQSFSDFELILIDDQSTDSSVEIARKYASFDSRIQVFQNSKNLGDYPNRNQAIRYANYEYLKFVDADDTLEANGLEIYHSAIQQFKALNPAYYFNVANPLVTCPKTQFLSSKAAYRRHYIDGDRTFDAAPTSCVYRKSFLQQYGAFEEARFTGDFSLAHRLSSHAHSVLIETPVSISKWRRHPNQQSEQNRTDLSVLSNYVRVSLRHLHVNRDHFSQEEYREILDTLRHMEGQSLRSLIKRMQFNQILRVFRNLNFPVHEVLYKARAPFQTQEQNFPL